MRTIMENLEVIDFREGYIAVIDKPLNWSSTDVVRKIRAKLSAKGYRKIKVGHAGTLDPLATGVLLVCIGKATKMVDALQAERKVYTTTIELGASTVSYDMEHPISSRYPTEHITIEMIEQTLRSLEGERMQTPPVYSAKKIEGVRAYEMARQGEEVVMRQALINIYSIELLEVDMPRITIRVTCSKGTYIRSLAHEIGEGVKSGGYLTSLRRDSSGGFTVANSWNLEDFLKKIDEKETKS